MKYIIRKIIFFLIILIPFWSFLVWFFYPKTTLHGLILDKTVLSREANEHRSLNWVLTHDKIVKSSGSQYDISDDYYGFFPVNRPEYLVRDLTFFDEEELDSLSDQSDFLYYTDAYGIYTNEWVYNRDINERSRLVYGGLSDESYRFYKKMYQKRKLAIVEFNNLASPTSLDLRFKMQDMLEVDFSGWTGRYYHSLDTLKNQDIPNWMKRLHQRYYNRPFDYPDIPGIVMIHESERIIVLQDQIDLENSIPIINTPEKTQRKYGLPEYLRFPYWFDVTFAKDTSDIYASYRLNTKGRGDSILASQGLTNTFPAIIGDSEADLRFYFCGDWADNPVPFGLSYFKGSEFLRKFFYDNRDPLDRKKFFWEYYLPLITTIYRDYMEEMDSLHSLPALRPLPPRHPEYLAYYRKNNVPLPDISAITSGRRYDPEQILGTRFIEESYRDSMRRAIEAEAARTGYFIGTYGDTIYVTKRDTLEDKEIDSLIIRNDSLRQAGVKPRKDSATRQEEEAVDTARPSFRPEQFRVGGGARPQNTQNGEQQSAAAAGSDEKLRYAISRDEPVKASQNQRLTERSSFVSSEELPDKYRVIIGSFKDASDARSHLSKMNDDEAMVVFMPRRSIYRLVYRSYPTKGEALAGLDQVLTTFPRAWIAKF